MILITVGNGSMTANLVIPGDPECVTPDSEIQELFPVSRYMPICDDEQVAA
jgi:hypothetical protein